MQLLGTYQVGGLDGAIIKQSQMVRRMNFPGARPNARQSQIPLKRFIKVGDTLEIAGAVYEVVRVTGWAYDTSWHCDLAQRCKPKAIKRA